MKPDYSLFVLACMKGNLAAKDHYDNMMSLTRRLKSLSTHC